MAKHPRPSLEAFAQPAAPPLAPEVTAKPKAESEPAKARHHTTLYLDRSVQKVIKEIAIQYDRRPHDLYIEGINLMLAQYGKPTIKEILGK